MILEAMDKAAEQSLRAGEIIRRLRDFVARGETERRIESLNKLLEEASALALVGTRDRGVRVTYAFDPAVDLVLVDKVQIQQVVLNLVRNAIEAMEQSPPPRADHRHRARARRHGRGQGHRYRQRHRAGDRVAAVSAVHHHASRRAWAWACRSRAPSSKSHGGLISVEPNPQGGTTFRFTVRAVSQEDLRDDR